MKEENDSEFEALYGIAKANLSMGKTDEAIANFLELGALYEEKDNLVKAYEIYKKILDLDPLNMTVLHKVGVIYNKLNPEEPVHKGKKKKEKKKKEKKKE